MMPAIHFTVRWPDGSEEQCYSPSTVVREHFKPGEQMSLTTFVNTAETALDSASHRVQQKFGYFCSSAMDQLSRIKMQACKFDDPDNQQVDIISVS